MTYRDWGRDFRADGLQLLRDAHLLPERRGKAREREFFIDNLLVRIHLIIEMICRGKAAERDGVSY